MRIFREEKLIDREKEIEFVTGWFKKVPKEILWIYGPKSSGKTTLVEYIVEKELFEDFSSLRPKGDYWVKYINLRGKLITSYNTFLEAIIKPKEKVTDKEEKLTARLNVGIFQIKGERLKKVKNKSLDLFDAMLMEIEEIAVGKRPIIIIDEIQTLEEIYINGDRELLKEFLNFCVRLTKELHISHVVILSSNTIFIDRIYNDAKLKVTSRFYKIDHLEKEITEKWLLEEGFKREEIELIWDYVGGCIPLIQRMMRDRHEFKNLKEYLDRQKWLAYTEIVDFLTRENNPTDEKIFRNIASVILKEGHFVLSHNMEDKYNYFKIIEKWAGKEILFFDPMELKVSGNNRLYEKGMEKLFE